MNRWAALDHVRALAAFLVFCWHFTHGIEGYPVPFEGAPAFPFAALLDEGHVGVALFMCLSGYLFARILEGKSVDLLKFVAARFVRLAPLLFTVFALNALMHLDNPDEMREYLKSLAWGWIFPTWPNGGWSLAIEFQFYLLLPFLLAARRRYPMFLAASVLAAIALRCGIFATGMNIQDAAYWTIFGRIDQFLLGILAFDLRSSLRGNHVAAATAAAALGAGYYLFDVWGGFVGLPESDKALWIVLPTFEGLTFAVLIAWYDNTFAPRGRISDAIAAAGFYSYGVYLLHFFFVFQVPGIIHRHVLDLSRFPVAVAASLVGFAGMLLCARVAYRTIEAPLQVYKPSYIRERSPKAMLPQEAL